MGLRQGSGLFNRTTLQVFVTYLTVALYVHPLWFYKHQHDNRVRSKLPVACQRWWFQWRFWFVPSVLGYLWEEEEHKSLDPSPELHSPIFKCIVYDKLLKPRQSFRITLYFKLIVFRGNNGYANAYIVCIVWTLFHIYSVFIKFFWSALLHLILTVTAFQNTSRRTFIGTNHCQVQQYSLEMFALLTLILLMWRIGWAPNNTSKWQMRFTSAFEVLISPALPLEILGWVGCPQDG